ncbi:cobalt transporter [Arsukibacterium sp.]|uniref:cobalt transporter n=1 Tax=Arsukibacterium sp. TaxID=1977258 RepID=UPI0035692D0D
MLNRSLNVLLLLLIMLNHAVIACDSLVIHLPEHNHSFTALYESHTPSNDSLSADDSEQHSEHAHVSCHIAFFYGIELLNFDETVIISSPSHFNIISYSPPVPPPNT